MLNDETQMCHLYFIIDQNVIIISLKGKKNIRFNLILQSKSFYLKAGFRIRHSILTLPLLT